MYVVTVDWLDSQVELTLKRLEGGEGPVEPLLQYTRIQS